MDLVFFVVLAVLAAVMVGATTRYLNGPPADEPMRPLPGSFSPRKLRPPSLRKLQAYRPPSPGELNADLRVGCVAAALFVAVLLLWMAIA